MKSKKCIWCSKSDNAAKFDKPAHTIPQALGGKRICVNVCDDCNAFFGTHYKGYPSVETILKETFNISRTRFLLAEKEIGKNKAMGRFTSIYFKVDLVKHKLDLKQSYKLHKGFQEKIARQLKKGLYKLFLEETERQFGTGHGKQFDFIREFARYDFGDYPVFYFERKHALILTVREELKDPVLHLSEDMQMRYLVNEPGFKEFELFGHVFGIATVRLWEIFFENYIRKSSLAKAGIFKQWRRVDRFNDIDFTLSILDKPISN